MIAVLRLVLLFALFSCSWIYGMAQSPTTHADSIKQLLAAGTNDTMHVRILNELVKHYTDQDQQDSALKYCNESIRLARKLYDKPGLVIAYTDRGRIYDASEKYLDAIKDYQRARNIYAELQDKKNIANMYNLIANSYHQEGDFPSALKNQLEALKIREAIGDSVGIAWSHNNIGTIYRIQGDYPAALKNYFESLSMLQKTGDRKMVAISYNNIGNVYALQGKYTEALNNYFASLRLRQLIGDKKEIIASYLNIGDAFCDLYENYSQADVVQVEFSEHVSTTIPKSQWLDTAMALQTKAHKLIEELGNRYFSIYSLSGMGRVQFLRKNYRESIHLYTEAFSVAEAMQAGELQKEISKYLADNYEKIMDYKNGMAWYSRYTGLKDSLSNQSQSDELTKIRMKFEFEKKEAEAKATQEKKDALSRLELVKQKKMRNLFLAGFILVLSFAGIFFYQRNNIRKEKMRSDGLLLNILPSEVASELKETGASRTRSFDQVTVLFADIVGFTTISEKFSPEMLVEELHGCFSAFDHILQKYQVEKIKTIGDAYMAAGGLPVPSVDSAKRTVLAALELLEYINRRKKENQHHNKPSFDMRVGIHTGPVVAGIVGVKKFQYDIWGDTVNTASRMESSGDVGKVNISESTYHLLQDDPDLIFESRGNVSAKGKGSMAMWFVGKHIN